MTSQRTPADPRDCVAVKELSRLKYQMNYDVARLFQVVPLTKKAISKRKLHTYHTCIVYLKLFKKNFFIYLIVTPH